MIEPLNIYLCETLDPKIIHENHPKQTGKHNLIEAPGLYREHDRSHNIWNLIAGLNASRLRAPLVPVRPSKPDNYVKSDI